MISRWKSHIRVGTLGTLILLTACQNPNEHAKLIGKPPEAAVKLRELQTRRFDSLDEKALLGAATEALQDLGFIISESASDVGVLTASKQRDAEEAGQVVGQIALTMFFAVLGAYYDPTWDKEQTIQVTLVATPIEKSRQIDVRVSFDRVLTNNKGIKWRAELIQDGELYKGFFDRLSQSVFLESNKS
jgi:hypothetical protein